MTPLPVPLFLQRPTNPQGDTHFQRGVIARFWPKVVGRTPSACWEWIGAKDPFGYGVFWIDERRRKRRAHRISYELLVGPIPNGLTLDHLCRNKSCVNPDHLDPYTSGENSRRSPLAPYWVKAAQTQCVNGHDFTVENTYVRPDRTRDCRRCKAARMRALRAAEREARE